MRLWTVHPKYLDPKGLVALWRETLLARKVLRGGTVGYRSHPQLERFREQRSPLACVESYLRAIHDESRVRGYRFDARKLAPARRAQVLSETRGQLLYEWAHLRRKLRARSPARYRELRRVRVPDPHPMFRIVPGRVRGWERTALPRRAGR